MKGLLSKLVKIAPTLKNGSQVISVRTICHKDHMDPEVASWKPKPWPYEHKKYDMFTQLVLKRDRTIHRWDENTKVICIDGNIGAGKTSFAKQLNEQLGMKFYPEPDFDRIFVDAGGFDYRTLNWRLPAWGQSMDIRMFYENPHHVLSPNMQCAMYTMRYENYLDSLGHLFSTGQGVISERSPWSDYVFVEAMYEMGFIKKDAREYLWELRQETEALLLRPHLVIYLDVPVDICLERIKKRGIPWEVKSEVTCRKYLEAIDRAYKEIYLPEISRHAELIVYDWSNYGDMDLVVEDLEKLDFDQYEARGEKTEDWRLFMEGDFDEMRRKYTNKAEDFFCKFQIPNYDYPSMEMPQDAAHTKEKVFENFGPKYHPGYDPARIGYFKSLFMLCQNYRHRQKFSLYSPYNPGKTGGVPDGMVVKEIP
ncbi:NADH dehydrogenase [ubiquinone] 1 alpha subcomplex subunit 10, mitochondrial [Halotydeus destructor]|nr:NADH dehydrogenase [ubiquinone] 1 alpha subcomplex subunit 10, mitochondrial [Halotydeus destructor]